MSQLKKVFTLSVALMTIVWAIGVFGISLTASAAVSGDLIKMPTSSEVSYVGADGKRYIFPKDTVFFNWYTDFSGVQEVSTTEYQSYPIGGNVTPKPGAKLVQFVTSDTPWVVSAPEVYAVAADGTLRHITSATVAAELYGANWELEILPVVSTLFGDYNSGADIAAAVDYDKAAETAAATSINTDKGLVAAAGGNLTVALAADTPASGIAVSNAVRVQYTKVNLTASSDGDVTIDSWVVKRTGLAQDAAFSGIDIVDASTNLPINDSSKTFTSEHTANFTEDFKIPAGTTRSVILTGNMGSLASYAGETPSLSLQSVTLKADGTIVGTLPITGNYQTLNGTITIGSATVSRGAYSNATSTSLEVGKTNYAFYSFKIQAGSVEEVEFNQIKIYQAGSASLTTDLANLKLYEDGTALADVVISGSYLQFNFTAVKLTKGQTKQFQVKGDVVSGSNRTILLAIYRNTDLLVKGLTYGYNITSTYSGTGSGSSSYLVLTDNQATIGTGTLRVGRSNTVAAGNIAVGTDQVIGAYEFEVKGEPVIISALTLTVVSSTSGTIAEDASRAWKLVDKDGKTVAGPTDVTNNALTVAFTDTFTAPAGTNVYKVVATIDTAGGWSTNDTIYVSINTPGSAITAKGETTGLTITATPASNTTSATQTVKAATLTVVKNSTPTNKSVITNSTNVLIGSWTFDTTNSGENVRITSIAVRASTTGKLNTLTLKDGAVTLLPVNDNPVTSNNANTTSTFTLTDPLVITKNTSKVINLYANIGSNTNAGEVDAWGITSAGAITAYGVSTGNSASVTVTAHNGALITIAAAGTLTINSDAAALASRLVVAGTTGEELATIRLKATNEAIDLTKITLFIADGALTGTASGDYTQVSKVNLKLDGAILGLADGYAIAAATKEVNFERGQFTIPEGTTGKKLAVLANIVVIGTNEPGTPNADVKLGLGGADGITAYGNGSNASATKTYTASTGTAVIIHKAAPTVVLVTPTNKLSASSVIHQAKVTAVGDNIGLYRLSYVTTSSTSVNITNGYLKLNQNCGALTGGTVLSSTVAAGTDIAAGTKTWTMIISYDLTGKAYLSVAKDSTCVVDFWATIGTSANVDTVSTSLLGDTATTTGETAGDLASEFTVNQQGNFVWSDLNSSDSQSYEGATKTAQWYNGYYVSGLGSTSTTTPVTVGE